MNQTVGKEVSLIDGFRCGDNVDYGYRFSQDFVDTPEKEVDSTVIYGALVNANGTNSAGRRGRVFRRGRLRRQMNLHNNEVGRRVSSRQNRMISIPIPFSRQFID